MTRRGAARAGALVLLAVPPRLAAQQGAVAEVVLPPPRAVVTSQRVLLWAPLRERAGTRSLQLRLGSRVLPAATADSGRFLHHPVLLSPGENRIALAAGDSVLESWELWYRPPFWLDAEAPEDIATFRLHRGGASAPCAGCHRGAWRIAEGAAVRLDSLACFGCHRDFDRAPVRHGPAAGWLCLACHRSEGGGNLAASPARLGPVCLSCHTEVAARLVSAPVTHGPAAGGYCTVCHDPHGSDQPALLRTRVPALCGSCHVDQADGSHVVGWTGRGRPHPVAGVPDPRDPGRELTCASCHDPHAAGARALFRGARSKEELCGQCHTGPPGPAG